MAELSKQKLGYQWKRSVEWSGGERAPPEKNYCRKRG